MNTNDRFVITISREVGSGGRTIGRKLAQKLGVRFCDKDVVEALTKKFDVTSYVLEKVKGRKSNLLSDLLEKISPLPKASQISGVDSHYSNEFRPDLASDEVFKAESEIIRGLAEQESCVIAGRSGFFVLKDMPASFHVFITASRKSRIGRVMLRQMLSHEQAAALIDDIDASRENYISRNTGLSRYDLRNYDLCLCVDGMNEDQAVDFIIEAIKSSYK